MMLSTERLLTEVYGVPATPVQRAACRARDGLPLRELRDHPQVVEAFGGADAVAALPSGRGIKPAEFWNIASARTAKTTIAACGAIADSQSIDLSGSALGDEIRISVLSVTLDVADPPFSKILAGFKHPSLRPLLIDAKESERLLLVRHPSGATIQIAVTAGGRAGAGIANRWCGGLIPDEAPKMGARADDRVTNLDDVLSVARERMLPNAQIAPIGSPWSPSGTAYDMVQQYFGKPTDDIVVMRTTGPAGNPSYWTPERLEKLKLKDEAAWRINALGEFIDPESGLLNPISVRKNTRESPLFLPPDAGFYIGAAVDVGKRRWTLVIVRGGPDQHDRRLPAFDVAYAVELSGIDPEHAWRQIAADCARYHAESAVIDQYAGAESITIARGHGLALRQRDWTPANRLESFTDLATMVHSDRVQLLPDRMFRRDLLAVKKRATQQGYQIHLPHTPDGRHCDFAPALVHAIQSAAARSKRRFKGWVA